MESDKSISTPSDGGLGDAGQRIRPLHRRTSGPSRRSTKGQWTAEEDEILSRAVQRFKGKNWKKIAECFKDRTDVQCLHRWQKVLNPELVKGPWSKEEDETIVECVSKFGPKKWSTIAQHLPGRIGKQCRERWHNHLNPAINKEAWTQEEELALIRAHQIYGNRWAELTKFLPGRTDNAIKNHWNSSVKKKLDSYLASGLLEQFQGLPLVALQNQSMPSSSSSRVQNSRDDSGLKCSREAKEISECSQESLVVSYPQSASDLGNLRTREEFQFTEESGLGKEPSSSSASCSDQYYTSLGDVSFSIPEIPCEVGCSTNFLQQSFSHNALMSTRGDYQFSLPELPNISSLEQGQESSEFSRHCIAANESHELAPFQNSMGLVATTSMGNITTGCAKLEQMLISDDECCRIIFSDATNDETFSSVNLMKASNVVDLGGNPDSSLHQPASIQISAADRTSAAQVYYPSRSCVLGTSCNQLVSPSLFSAEDSVLVCGSEPNQLTESFGTHDQELITSIHDGFIYTNEAANSPCDDCTDNKDLQEHSYLKEPPKVVLVDNSGSSTIQSHQVDEKPNLHTEQQDAGALCYEPPRFPSLDMPFLSCDLIQSGNDMEQEYSPLGIRQLMMSSMNCISPFRLWDSPSRDDSPDALLKNAAKTFTGTPSILKKRNRDLLSPLSDRRGDKKLEIDLASSLTKEFSQLDVMFDERGTQKASMLSPSSEDKTNSGSSSEDKENVDPALEGVKEKGKGRLSGDEAADKDFDAGTSQERKKKGTVDLHANTKIHQDGSARNVQQLGVLVEDNISDMSLFSPDQVGFKGDRAFFPSARTPRNLYRRILGTLSEQAAGAESSSVSPCLVVSSPKVGRRNHENHLVAAASEQPITSSEHSENLLENTRNDIAVENCSKFGETPLKRSIESPSAWKSPWFINSFLPGSRIDTELSIEDIGYFMSPGDRSLDAIALMQQLSEHTASAYADALEVLGNETPETIKGRSSINQDVNQEDNNMTNNELEKVPNECRVLDFSECGTPGKGSESGRPSAGVSFSSPSAYLLKGCR